MFRLPFSPTAYDRTEFGLPTLALENWFPEARPELGQYRLLPTPGLVSFASLTRPRGAKWSDGLFGGDLIVADGETIRRVAQAGAISDIGQAASDAFRTQFAVSQFHLVACAGGGAWEVSETGLESVTLPSGGRIISVAELNQRHLYVEEGTGRCWWSETGSPRDIKATYFGVSETEPDKILSVQVYRGSVYLFGVSTVEVWQNTQSDAAAFVPRPNVKLDEGLIGRDAVTQTDEAMFMVSRAGRVLRLDGLRQTPISTPHLEARINALTLEGKRGVSLTSWRWRGHEFIRLTIPQVGNWNYDLATGSWHRVRDLGKDTHFISDYVEAWGASYGLGTGGIFSLSEDDYTESNNKVRRVAELLIPITDKRPAIDDVTVFTSVAGTPASGEGSTPKIMMRFAQDGVNFDTEVTRDLPAVGEYAKPVTWGPLGRQTPPVARMQLAYTDPVGVTLSDAFFNMERP